MREHVNRFISNPFFLALLPVYYVMQKLADYYGLLSTTIAVEIALVFIGISLLLWIILKSKKLLNTGAALFVFLLMYFQLHYGIFQDAMKKWWPGSFVLKYSFLLPAISIIVILLFLALRKFRIPVNTLHILINAWLVFMIIYLATDLSFSKVKKDWNKLPQLAVTNCTTCPKPDVYLIVADEYAGYEQLKTVFDFDNSMFLDELRKKGFRVLDHTTSNYTHTEYSIASTLNGNYLPIQIPATAEGAKKCFDWISDNQLTDFFELQGYKIYNHSIFTINDKKSKAGDAFRMYRKDFFLDQTFTSRVKKDIGYHLYTAGILKMKEPAFQDNYSHDLVDKKNKKLMQETLRVVSESGSQPKFVYTHLLLPHYPYVYDSTGKFLPQTKENEKYNKGLYLSYLKYANQSFLQFLGAIQNRSNNKAIVIFMSDHGFRYLHLPTKSGLHYKNINCVYLPAPYEANFYDSMSNVNQFRVLFNGVYKQKLPLLKDSLCFLEDSL